MRHGITIRMKDLSRAVSSTEEAASCTSIVVDLENLSRKGSIQSFIEIVQGTAVAGETFVPVSQVRPASVNPWYMLGFHILSLKDTELEKWCIKDLKSIQDNCSNDLLLTALRRSRKTKQVGAAKQRWRGRKWASLYERIALLLMSVTWDSESQECGFLQYKNVLRPIENDEETLGGFCSQGSTDAERNHSLGQSTGAIKEEGLNARKWLGIQRSPILKGCVKVRRASLATQPFREIFPYSSRRIQINRFYKDL